MCASAHWEEFSLRSSEGKVRPPSLAGKSDKNDNVRLPTTLHGPQVGKMCRKLQKVDKLEMEEFRREKMNEKIKCFFIKRKKVCYNWWLRETQIEVPADTRGQLGCLQWAVHTRWVHSGHCGHQELRSQLCTSRQPPGVRFYEYIITGLYCSIFLPAVPQVRQSSCKSPVTWGTKWIRQWGRNYYGIYSEDEGSHLLKIFSN